MITAILGIVNLVLRIISEQIPSVAVRNAKKAANAVNLEKAVKKYEEMVRIPRRTWDAILTDRLRRNKDN